MAFKGLFSGRNAPRQFLQDETWSCFSCVNVLVRELSATSGTLSRIWKHISVPNPDNLLFAVVWFLLTTSVSESRSWNTSNTQTDRNKNVQNTRSQISKRTEVMRSVWKKKRIKWGTCQVEVWKQETPHEGNRRQKSGWVFQMLGQAGERWRMTGEAFKGNDNQLQQPSTWSQSTRSYREQNRTHHTICHPPASDSLWDQKLKDLIEVHTFGLRRWRHSPISMLLASYCLKDDSFVQFEKLPVKSVKLKDGGATSHCWSWRTMGSKSWLRLHVISPLFLKMLRRTKYDRVSNTKKNQRNEFRTAVSDTSASRQTTLEYDDVGVSGPVPPNPPWSAHDCCQFDFTASVKTHPLKNVWFMFWFRQDILTSFNLEHFVKSEFN